MPRDDPTHAPRVTVKHPPSRRFARFLYSQNPFYLLSVCCVLHGVGLWYHATRTSHSPWILVALIGGLIALLATTGFAIVRLGQVWEDARSILLTLLILFLELALTTDDVLVGDRNSGRAMLFAGWLVAAVVSEFLLLGLRIRLPVLYRVPFHSMLATLFFYPVCIVHGSYPRGDWILPTIFHFSTVIAANILLLLPAVRRGPDYVRRNGTPWAWPMFPWSMFVVLIGVLVARMYSVSVSFDPVLDLSWSQAAQFENAFGPLFFTPILLAVSVLIFERAAQKNSLGWSPTLAIPLFAVAAAIPPHDPTSLYGNLYARLASELGSPVWFALLGVTAAYAYAAIRKLPYAFPSLICALMGLAVVGPATVSFQSFTSPQLLPTAIVAGGMFRLAIRARSSLALFAAVSVALSITWPIVRELSDTMQAGLVLNVVIIAAGGSAMLYEDRHSHFLRICAAAVLVGGTVWTIWAAGLTHVSSQRAYGQLMLFALIAVGLYARFRGTAERRAAIAVGASSVLLALWDVGNLVIGLPGGVGLMWIGSGLLSFAAGTAISLYKAVRRGRATVSRSHSGL